MIDGIPVSGPSIFTKRTVLKPTSAACHAEKRGDPFWSHRTSLRWYRGLATRQLAQNVVSGIRAPDEYHLSEPRFNNNYYWNIVQTCWTQWGGFLIYVWLSWCNVCVCIIMYIYMYTCILHTHTYRDIHTCLNQMLEASAEKQTRNQSLYHRYSIDITIHIPHIFHRYSI